MGGSLKVTVGLRDAFRTRGVGVAGRGTGRARNHSMETAATASVAAIIQGTRLVGAGFFAARAAARGFLGMLRGMAQCNETHLHV